MRVALCQPNTNISWGFGHLYLWSFDWRIPENGSGFEIKALIFPHEWIQPSSSVDISLGGWANRPTSHHHWCSMCACVCVNQKQVCVSLVKIVPSWCPAVSGRWLVWKPELQLNSVLISDGAQQVFFVAWDVTEIRVGTIIKVLITQNIDDNPLDQEMWAAIYTGHETKAG